MMTAALLLLGQAAMPAPEDEIVVTARQVAKVRWSFHARDGRLERCDIKRSSGSARVDAMVCEASRQCAAEQPTLGDRHLTPCIKERVGRMVADRRASASRVAR